MPLTKEQFTALRQKGLTTEQIVSFDKGEKPVPSGYGIDDVGRDLLSGAMSVATLPADFLNQVAFDVPRQAMEKYVGEGSWDANYGNNALETVQKIGGVAGGLVGGGKLNQVIMSGIKSLKKIAPLMRGGTQSIAAGTTTGALEGGIRQEDLEYTPENVIGGVGIGALSGGLAIPIAQAGGRVIQKTFSGIPKNVQEIPGAIEDFFRGTGIRIKQKLTPEQRISQIKSTGRRLGKEKSIAKNEEDLAISKERDAKVKDIEDRKEFIKQRALSVGGDRAKKTAAYQQGMARLRSEGKQEIDIINQKLNIELDQAISGSVTDIQTALPKLYREASASFDSRIKTIDEGRVLTPQNVREFFTDVLNDSSVKSGPAYDAIAQKAEKYGLKIISDDNKFGFDRIEGLTSKPISIRELQSDISEIGSKLSSSVKGGERFTGSDIPYAVMKDKLSSFVPELQELRSSYRPILLAMKQSSRIFKPGLGEAGTKSAEHFLKRLANGNITKQDQWMLDMIQKPTEFTSGIGGTTQRVSLLGKSVKDNVANIKKVTEARMSSLKNKYQQQIAATSGDSIKMRKEMINLGVELRVAKEQANLAKQAASMGKISSEKEWLERLSSLAKTEEKVLKIRNAKEKARMLKIAIASGAGVVAAVAGGTAAVRHGIGKSSAMNSAIESAVSE